MRRFYERFKGDDQVLIVINADPDAIASAMAVKRLLWRKVAHVAITHVNLIKRPDNLTMIRTLSINLSYEKDMDKSRFNRFVLVDSQPNHHESFSRYTFDVIIDHHPDTLPAAAHTDIRPKYGATATILTEYLQAAKIRPSAKLATALFYAIKTDTGDFEQQALIEDVRAFQFLFRLANMHLVRRLEQADLRLDFLKYFQMAIERKCIRRGRAYVHLGAVLNPDVCVVIADFFMRIHSIKWSIVSGIYDKKLVVIIRNDGLKKNAGKMVKDCFGQIGSAGGHKSMARAEIPLETLAGLVDLEDHKCQHQWLIQRMERSSSKRKDGKKDHVIG
ncbi:MAG: DHH family phosphoesterase [Thermodesulfobacteriota bacterium]